MPLRIFKINKTKEPDDKKNVDLSDKLEKLEKEYRRVKQQIQLKNDNMILSYSALLPKTPSIHLKNKDQKQERMRRARSMPKMNEQDIVSIL